MCAPRSSFVSVLPALGETHRLTEGAFFTTLTPQEASSEAGALHLREPGAARRGPRVRTESVAKSTEPGSRGHGRG